MQNRLHLNETVSRSFVAISMLSALFDCITQNLSNCCLKLSQFLFQFETLKNFECQNFKNRMISIVFLLI